MMRLFNRIAYGVIALSIVFLAGVVGYHFVEGWTWGEAMYSTVLVISTLGFGDQKPITGAGQILTSVLIVSGVGTLFYLLSNAAETLLETSLGVRQIRRMERRIAQLEGHYIICGYGRVGKRAAQEFAAQDEAFVIIDDREAAVEEARGDGWAAIQGDATADQTLDAAGLVRAKGLLLTTPSDAVNVFITLTARISNEDIIIVARANAESSEAKLIKAGATKVIAPEVMGGQRMASLALRPDAMEVIDALLHADDADNWLEQAVVSDRSAVLGQTLAQARLHQRLGIRIIAIRRLDGALLTNPHGEVQLRRGDTLVSVGEREQLAELHKLIEGE